MFCLYIYITHPYPCGIFYIHICFMHTRYFIVKAFFPASPFSALAGEIQTTDQLYKMETPSKLLGRLSCGWFQGLKPPKHSDKFLQDNFLSFGSLKNWEKKHTHRIFSNRNLKIHFSYMGGK